MGRRSRISIRRQPRDAVLDCWDWPRGLRLGDRHVDRLNEPAGGGGGPAFGLVFEEDGFDEFFDELLFVGVEVLGGFEGEV